MPSHVILSEIDAIFANKTTKNQSEEKSNKRKNDDSNSNELNKSGTKEEKKKKKKKKNQSTAKSGSKQEKEEKEDEDVEEVEEIIDPSINILKISNQLGGIDSITSSSSSSSKKVLLDDEELAFRDSRGTRARTDDGLPIYSVEELNIGLGGDTEACPFDCECCF